MSAAPYKKYLDSKWVNKKLQSLNLKEKIGQLFIVEAFSTDIESENVYRVIESIKKFNIGGITFFQGNIKNQAYLTNKFQQEAKIPIFINIDAEWGLGMRLDDAVTFPYNMALGAIEEDSLIYDYAKNLAKQLKRIGSQSPLAPVVDINNNPENPVINYRSFGENKYRVANKGVAFIKGLQSENILDNAKHFPGHGDTDTDSHLGMPVLNHSFEQIDEIDLYPFKKMIEAGASSIMSAHLHIPSIDNEKDIPASLSKKAINELLKEKLNFKGLVISDAFDMQGITNFYNAGEADPIAIYAGNDMISLSTDLEKAINKIHSDVLNSNISEKYIEDKCREILAVKQWMKLDKIQNVKLENIVEEINNEESDRLNEKLADAATTLLKYNGKISVDKNSSTAFLYISNKDISLSKWAQIQHHQQAAVQRTYTNSFAESLVDSFPNNDHFSWNTENEISALKKIVGDIKNHDRIVISVHGLNIKPINNFDIPVQALPVLKELFSSKKVTFILFGNAYALNHFENVEMAENIIITYQENEFFHKSVSDLLIRGKHLSATLPVSVNEHYKEGDGVKGFAN
ncbi:MAG: glycoside hydrolase family 3 N-terminal domain-containing protein [Bacteroidota bacterium]